MKPSERRKARRLAVQAIYSWQISGNRIADVELNFLTEQEIKGVDVAYFRELLAGVANHASSLDAKLTPHIDRDFQELDPVEKAILRLGVYELTFRQDVPYKVVINEAIELAKAFGAEESHKFVNGSLDKFVRSK